MISYIWIPHTISYNIYNQSYKHLKVRWPDSKNDTFAFVLVNNTQMEAYFYCCVWHNEQTVHTQQNSCKPLFSNDITILTWFYWAVKRIQPNRAVKRRVLRHVAHQFNIIPDVKYLFVQCRYVEGHIYRYVTLESRVRDWALTTTGRAGTSVNARWVACNRCNDNLKNKFNKWIKT